MKIKLITDTPQFVDLVNNYELFHKTYTPTDLLKLPTWIDHSDYSNYPHIDDLLSTLTVDDIVAQKSWTVVIPLSYINSSDESLGGYDRPIWTSIHGDTKCRESLSVKTEDGNLKGFNPEDAGTLTVYLRPCGVDTEGNLLFQVVKCIGNGRSWKKLLVNRGENSEVKAEIFFHTEGEYSDWLKKESDVHATDAGARSGQNEKQKFVSSYRAGRPDAVYCFDFLKRMKLEYGNIMELERYKNDDNSKDWLEITSLQGIKEGDGNGYFNKYTEASVIEAVKITKKIASTITNETAVGTGPIKCFSQMYRIFTLYGLQKNSPKGVFTKEELSDFFVKFFEYKNPKLSNVFGDSATFELRKLSVSGSTKDVTYINVTTFWPEIVGYYKQINKKKHGFSFESQVIIKLLDSCKDRFLLGPIKAKIAA